MEVEKVNNFLLKQVCLTGSFNKWKEHIPMNLIPDEKDPTFVVILNLPIGTHDYKVNL